MTQTKEATAAGRRRFTWSIESLGNRAAYSFVVAILANIAMGAEALSLAIGLALFLVLTAIVTVGRRR
jgi:FtsH-binding integral membrane protein